MLLRYPTLDLHRLWAILHLKPHFHFQVPLHLEAHTDGHTFQCKLRIVKIIIWYHYYYLVLHEIILLWKNTQLSKSSTKVPLIAQRKTEFLIRQSKKKTKLKTKTLSTSYTHTYFWFTVYVILNMITRGNILTFFSHHAIVSLCQKRMPDVQITLHSDSHILLNWN